MRLPTWPEPPMTRTRMGGVFPGSERVGAGCRPAAPILYPISAAPAVSGSPGRSRVLAPGGCGSRCSRRAGRRRCAVPQRLQGEPELGEEDVHLLGVLLLAHV